MLFTYQTTLKNDAFGAIEKGLFKTASGMEVLAIKRIYSQKIFLRGISKLLGWNECRALKKLMPLHLPYFPDLLFKHKDYHIREFLKGDAIYRCTDYLTPEYFKHCKDLLRCMRRAGVSNNDLAKEANWLIDEATGLPAITDFQLAWVFSSNSKMARIFAREDLRHLLKHQRKYAAVRTMECRILERRSVINRLWMGIAKPIYLFITRKLLGWKDRTGPEERDI
jgi:hypothetical protein